MRDILASYSTTYDYEMAFTLVTTIHLSGLNWLIENKDKTKFGNC